MAESVNAETERIKKFLVKICLDGASNRIEQSVGIGSNCRAGLENCRKSMGFRIRDLPCRSANGSHHGNDKPSQCCQDGCWRSRLIAEAQICMDVRHRARGQ